MPSSIELAVKAFREKRFPEAVSFFEEIRKAQPQNPKIAFSLAQSYQAVGRMVEAHAILLELKAGEDANIVQLATRALETIVLPAAPPEAERGSELFCPECGNPVPPERAQAPWCACGWGIRRLKGDDCLYLAHLKTATRELGRSLELKMHGDLYAIVDNAVWIKHLSDQMTPIDPRQVFRVDQGQPYLQREDLDRFMPKVDDRAVVRLGQIGSVGKLLTWEELLEKVKAVVPDPSHRPEGGLKSVLAEYSDLPPELLDRAEQEGGAGRLGTILLESGACTLQVLLESALGTPHVFAPAHHQRNHIGRLLLEAGAISELVLKQALIMQIKRPRPLEDILRAQVSPAAMRQALRALERLPQEGPETDRLGEVLFAMGAISRTELTQALQERAKRSKLTGKIMQERGMVTDEVLVEALTRQQLKRSLRAEGEVRLGTVLVELQACEPKHLARGLVAQIRDPRPIGEILVGMAAITPEQLVTAIAEQERRLDALAERRLPAALKKAQLSDIDLPPKKTRKRERIPLADEAGGSERRKSRQTRRFKRDEQDAESGSPRLPRPILLAALAGAVLLAGGLVIVRGIKPPAPSPQVAASAAPMRGQAASPGAVPVERRPAFSSLTAANVVNVDVDQVMERLEKGDPNPLGEGFLGASGSGPIKLDPSLQAAVERKAGVSTGSAGNSPSTRGSLVGSEGVGDLDLDEPVAAVKAPQAKLPAGTQAGIALANQGNLPGAEKALQTALTKVPGNADVLGQLGQVQRRMGKLPQAEHSLGQAARLSPDRPQVWADLGATRLQRGNVAGAIAAFSSGVQAAPRDPAMHNRLGLALLQKGRPADARKAFEGALKVDPGNPNSHFNLGLLQAKEDAAGARDHYEQASDGFYELVDSRMALADALKAQGDLRGSLESYRGALRANTLLAQVELELGKLDLQARDARKATEHFKTSKLAYRANAIARDHIGLVLASLKKSRQAEVEWLQATKIAPFYAPPAVQLGNYYRLAGRSKEAERYFALAKQATVKQRLNHLLDSL